MPGRLSGKVAIITGAAGGMGEAAAHLFAREGAKVALVDISAEKQEPVTQAVIAEGGEAISIGADISGEDGWRHIVAETTRVFGTPTVLFNNAGVDTEGKKSLLDITVEEFDRNYEVNCRGVWLGIKHVAPGMIAAGGGAICNTASIGAFISASTVGYCASKAGAVAISKVAAVELGKHKVRVNALCPGATETPMAREQRKEMQARGLPTSNELIDRMGVLGRMADPMEMAHVALFLCSDEAGFATGMHFNNDGGWTAMSGVNVQAFAKPG